ncbi:MAG: peptidylprolyl isomerase [Nitrospira sp.]|nr:peptidylprolyl isomerase [Nitrospira sp.]
MTRWITLQCIGVGVLLSCASMVMPVFAETASVGDSVTVSEGSAVSLEYTLALDDQSVLESNVGKEPMTYTHGAHEIVPGLEKAMEGMKVGERKHIVVAPEDGYGPFSPQGIREVKKDLIPTEALKVGVQLQGQTADGEMAFPIVKEIKEETVVLDFNHPLAGKTLHFNVAIVSIKAGQLPKQP